MKAFSLDEYLKNPSRKLVTRGGRTVERILCTDARGDYPIVALVDCGCYDIALPYTKDGGFYACKETSVNDLFFAAERHEGWVNLYRGWSGQTLCGIIYNSEAEAKNCGRDVLATVKIEWEE